MEKIFGALAVAVITFTSVNAGMAQVSEAAPSTAYPDPQCTKPDIKSIKPPKLNDARDAGDVAAYNAGARAYNSEVKAFDQTSAIGPVFRSMLKMQAAK